MGKRGPLPKPASVLKLHGSWRAGERERSEVSVPSGEPPMPGRVAESEAKALVWRETVALLKRVPGLLSVNDGEILACYCDSKVDYEEGLVAIAREGEVLVDHNGRAYLNPRVSVKNKALARMADFWKRFGLSPADRANLHIDAPTDADEFATGGRGVGT